MTESEATYDLVIVGSGGGGLVAALAAKDAGLNPIILEKQGGIGGSTAMSGGVIWMPDNPLMRADRAGDSLDAGLTYFRSVVGEPDEGSSLARRTAFLTRGPEMIAFLQGRGVRLRRAIGYSDYYDNRPGGNAEGRSVEGVPWDGKQLGEWHTKVNPGLARGLNLNIMTNELRSLPAWSRSTKAFLTTTRVLTRTFYSRARGRDLFTNGMSLVGQILRVILDSNIPIWLDSAVQELVVEDGRVVGIKAVRSGVPVLLRARHGVLLAAGGFERNPEMRRKYSGESQPNDASWTMANLGNTGEVLSSAIALGAKVDYMDDAIWTPMPRFEVARSSLGVARQWPHTILVDKTGRRFCNESDSTVEVAQLMYANDSVPAWLIFDDDYRRSIPWGTGLPKLKEALKVLPGRMPADWVSKQWIQRGDTIEDLARAIDVDPTVLAQTIREFNAGAVDGLDPAFGRGASQYNRILGDPRHRPNPAIGPLARAPYYATQIYPGDVGTIGGLICNEKAQVVDQQDQPIPGLYATGNISATVMGRMYPGAGASISNTTVFGYIAARHVVDLAHDA